MSQIDQARQAKLVHKAAILSRPNVVGLGVGYKLRRGAATDELSVVVLVRQKVPLAGLTDEAVIPQELEGVRTDVVEVGDLRALYD